MTFELPQKRIKLKDAAVKVFYAPGCSGRAVQRGRDASQNRVLLPNHCNKKTALSLQIRRFVILSIVTRTYKLF